MSAEVSVNKGGRILVRQPAAILERRVQKPELLLHPAGALGGQASIAATRGANDIRK